MQLIKWAYDQMLQDLFTEEWFELIIEEVVGNANLDYMWDRLPDYMQN